MKIVFYDTLLENIGVQLLSSILKTKNYNVDIVYVPESADPFNFMRDYDSKLTRAINDIMELKPELVGFSVYTHNYQFYRSIAKEIKKLDPSIIILFGGIHVTLSKSLVLQDEFVDFAIVGEAEEAIVELLEEIQNGRNYEKVKNLCYKDGDIIKSQPCRPYIRDLDTLPFPDKDVYINKNPFLRVRYHISASRGCPFSCTFCSNNVLHEMYGFEKNHNRFRSPENVIAELVEAKRKYNIKSVFFIDELFTFNNSWLEKFAKLYRAEINLPSDCITHPSFIKQETAELLKRINTQVVAMGVQIADEKFRRSTLKRKESNDRIAKSIKLLKDQGIKVAIDHIFGLPGETMEMVANSVKYYSYWKPTYVTLNWLAYYPNTDIIKFAIEEGNLREENISEIEQGKHWVNYDKLPKKRKRMYLRYKLLMISTGLLPGWLIRFLLKNIYLVLPSNLLAEGIHLSSRLLFQRKPWAFDYLKLIIKDRLTLKRFQKNFLPADNNKKFNYLATKSQ
jgi:radical SAM superfamily enzyme YgiQ (UPF0313 family)